MNSIYKRRMGTAFDRLHPKIQQRFGFDSNSGIACMGTGVMHEVWHGAWYTLPFLYVGAWRRIMFPERGREIPFTIENYAFIDPFGRECVTWIRKFAITKPRRFDAYMIDSAARGCIVDYLGTHEHLAVDLQLSVAPNGGMRLISGSQRFYEGFLGFRFPLLFSGVAEVCEWYDDAAATYRIEVVVRNRLWGRLFGYTGSFNVVYQPATSENIPAELLPIRYEKRE